MRADLQPGTAEEDGDGLTAPEAQGHGHARMRGKILRDGNYSDLSLMTRRVHPIWY